MNRIMRVSSWMCSCMVVDEPYNACLVGCAPAWLLMNCIMHLAERGVLDIPFLVPQTSNNPVTAVHG